MARQFALPGCGCGHRPVEGETPATCGFHPAPPSSAVFPLSQVIPDDPANPASASPGPAASGPYFIIIS